MLELKKGKNLDDAETIGIFPSEQDCFAKMWESDDFSSPYFRTWGTEFVKTVDYGSHTDFYFIVKIKN